MKYSLVIAEAAENDIRIAFLWYEEQQEKLGGEFERQISKALASIQDNPLKAQVRYASTRVFFIRKFPFGIHYIIREEDILVLAVFHTSQNPESWYKRG